MPVPDMIHTAPANAEKNDMGFIRGSANAGTLILMFCAWLLLNAPEQGEQLWPYFVFGAVFVVLLAHLFHIVLGASFGLFVALMHGIPLAFAAYWLDRTPYEWLEYACWAFAAIYAIIVPRMIRALARTDAGSSHIASGDGLRSTAARTGFDLENLALAVMIVVAIAGLIMGTGLVARQWGLLAGIAAFVLWPITLIVTPWYAAIVNDGWLMLAVVYGGGGAGALMYLRAHPRRNQDAADIPHPAREKP
jgi:hypothetical protein